MTQVVNGARRKLSRAKALITQLTTGGKEVLREVIFGLVLTRSYLI